MDSKFRQMDTKFGKTSNQIEILLKEIMIIREKPTKSVEIFPAKIQQIATLKQ